MTQPSRPPFCRRSSARALALVLLSLSLAGCGIGSWFGKKPPPPLPGERISVLLLERKLEPDPRIADLKVTVPPTVRNESWPQAGGNAEHVIGNPDLGGDIREAWRSDIGSGSSGNTRLLTGPVVADGRVYTIDTDFRVTAFEAGTGREIWRTDVTPENTRGDAMGGGVAFGEGRLLVGSGQAEVLSLDPATGKIQWRQKVPGPVRAAPTISNGRAFAVTIDNQLTALSLGDGSVQWTHTGILETAGLLGTASPAAEGGIVVVPYSSGELFALRVENGRVAWSDTLSAVRGTGALSSLADIRGMPVIDRGLVLAVSHSGRMVGIDERSGGRAWEQEIGGIDTPWAAGDFAYVLSNDQEVVCLTRQAGRIRWVSPLERYEDPKARTDPITWTGPVMAGGRLWLGSTTGELVALSPADGSVARRIDVGKPIPVPPVVANGTLYLLTDNGKLIAYR